MRLRRRSYRMVNVAKAHIIKGYGLCRGLVNVLAAVTVICIAMPSARAADPAPDPQVVLALGDSLTAGYGLEQGTGFVGQLQAALQAQGHDITVINAGVSGDTSAGGRSRLDWLLTPEIGAVIVELGANDGLRGLDPAQTRENLDWILDRLTQKGLPVVFSGMVAPPNLGKDYGQEFNSIYPDLAEKYDVTFDPFFLQGVAADPALNQDDGIHPNPEGVGVIVERMVPLVVGLFDTAR